MLTMLNGLPTIGNPVGETTDDDVVDDADDGVGINNTFVAAEPLPIPPIPIVDGDGDDVMFNDNE